MDSTPPRARSRSLPLLVLGILLASCSKPSAPPEKSREPTGPRLELTRPIPVQVGGEQRAPIDAARLQAARPDFAEADRRAWRLTSLVPEYAAPEALLEVTNDDGVSTVYPSPASGKLGQQAPVLTVDRKGRAVLTLVTGEDPFPSFHGRGGNRGRPGDPAPRVHDLARLSVRQPGSGTGQRSGEHRQ